VAPERELISRMEQAGQQLCEYRKSRGNRLDNRPE
jgi:hypothetical protein